MKEQLEIVRRVEVLFALADTIERRVAAAIARTDKVPQAILAKAFRGELVPAEAELASSPAKRAAEGAGYVARAEVAGRRARGSGLAG